MLTQPGVEPAEIISGKWAESLRRNYTPQGKNPPFERVIAIAEGHGVETVVVERRYIDPDYRSEHARFYAETFKQHWQFCDRLHFFTRPVSDDLDLSGLDDAYRGYTVIRPGSSSPVGRTMLRPPQELNGAAVCVAPEVVHPFGYPLTIIGMPFISQDEQYLRCAHAAQWMILYHSYLLGRLPRRLPEDIHDAAKGGRVVGRQVPSEGLSPSQMLASLQAMHISASIIQLPGAAGRDESNKRKNTSLFAVLCRYVNSQMPPIVISKAHAWVVIAYAQSPAGRHDDTILYRHDDAKGPYIKVDDPWKEQAGEYEDWWLAIPPLPRRVYLSAERAEPIGKFWFENGAHQLLEKFHRLGPENLAAEPINPQVLTDLRERIQEFSRALDGDRITYRTYAIRSHRFKREATEGRLPPKIARLYRLSHLPGYVWVVEALDRARFRAGEPCVVGETIIDSTVHHLSKADETSRPALLALSIAGAAFVDHPDLEDESKLEIVDSFEPYTSGCPVLKWRQEPCDAESE